MQQQDPVVSFVNFSVDGFVSAYVIITFCIAAPRSLEPRTPHSRFLLTLAHPYPTISPVNEDVPAVRTTAVGPPILPSALALSFGDLDDDGTYVLCGNPALPCCLLKQLVFRPPTHLPL